MSPFLLRKAVLSCINSISTVFSEAWPAFRGFVCRLLDGAAAGVDGGSASLMTNLMSRISLCESTYPRPRNPAVVSFPLLRCSSEYNMKILLSQISQCSLTLAGREEASTSSSASVTGSNASETTTGPLVTILQILYQKQQRYCLKDMVVRGAMVVVLVVE